MKVLIACERSGVVREAFASLGHDAWSCDTEPTDVPGKHFQTDVLNVLHLGWDLLIAHPPCTYLTVTGNKWNKPEFQDRFPDREERRKQAVDFFMKIVNAEIPMIAIENPVGIMSSIYRQPDQIFQPMEFGHNEPKRTCLWLKNLPALYPTKIVEGEYMYFRSGSRMPKWYATATGDRAKVRSKTFQGVADAMAKQWTEYANGTQVLFNQVTA